MLHFFSIHQSRYKKSGIDESAIYGWVFCFIRLNLRRLNNRMIYIADYIDSVNEIDIQTDNIDSIVNYNK